MKILLISALALLPTTALAAPSVAAPVSSNYVEAPVGQWRTVHPDAAHALDTWINTDSEAAAVLAFTKLHPGRTKILLDWAVAHPGATLSDFNAVHPNMVIDLKASPNGAMHLMNWARANASAEQLITASPRGFGVEVLQK